MVDEVPEATGVEDLHAELATAEELDLDRRLALLRAVETRLSEALEGLDGL